LTTAPDIDPEVARKAREWLHGTDVRFLRCRNNHAFPKLAPRNGRLRKGITATPVPQVLGHFQIAQVCPDCGTKRIFTWQSGTDLLTASRKYHYEWPEGYRMPVGAMSVLTLDEIRAEALEQDGMAALLEAAAAG
jgi:hypothetical protein